MTKRPYRLVPDELSHDTVECLEELLEHAKAGQLIGMAFALMYKGGRFCVNTSGEATRSPVFSRGMAATLDDHLSDLVRGQGV